MAHQRRQITRSVAQRRQLNRDHVQAEEQVFAKAAVGHRAGQILVGGGENAHIDLDRLATAHAFDLARFDGAQQFGLCFGTQVADFVEKECAGMRQLETAYAPVGGPRECAALVAEHLALDEVARNRRTVHANIRSVASRTRQMQRRRHELFPRS